MKWHPQIVQKLRERPDLIRKHRETIDYKNWLLFIVTHDTPEEQRKVAAMIKAYPKGELFAVIEELLISEQKHPFLKEERYKYEQEKRDEEFNRYNTNNNCPEPKIPNRADSIGGGDIGGGIGGSDVWNDGDEDGGE